MGGKNRTRKQIAKYLKTIRKPYQTYFEPFCGGAWVLQEMAGKRIASDGCFPLIAMYKDLQNGWEPPETLTEDEYQELKKLDDPYCGMKAFAGFGCSHSGKYFNGYARSGSRNYCSNAKNSLLKQLPLIADVQFLYGEYNSHIPVDMLVYCDPPYKGTTQYGYFETFDHEKFWDKIREWSKYNTVIVSEYNAPNDFECVLSLTTKTDMRVAGNKEIRVERLFRIKDV
jgi:DNA adenine methylase